MSLVDSMNRKRKSPHTQLETLNSSQALVILLLPFFLSCATILLDTNMDLHNKSALLSRGFRSDIYSCDWKDDSVSFTIKVREIYLIPYFS